MNTNNMYYTSKGKIKTANEQLTVYCVKCFGQQMLARTIRVTKSQKFFSTFSLENIGAVEFSKEMPKEVLIKYIRQYIVLNDVCAFKGNQQ